MKKLILLLTLASLTQTVSSAQVVTPDSVHNVSPAEECAANWTAQMTKELGLTDVQQKAVDDANLIVAQTQSTYSTAGKIVCRQPAIVTWMNFDITLKHILTAEQYAHRQALFAAKSAAELDKVRHPVMPIPYSRLKQ